VAVALGVRVVFVAPAAVSAPFQCYASAASAVRQRYFSAISALGPILMTPDRKLCRHIQRAA
jgi:hypothetical protein